MEKVVRYKCGFCGDLFRTEKECLEHEDRHKRVDKANEMWEEGKTLQDVQDECSIWYSIPEHLKDVTKDNCFVISHWQCCSKPAYRIMFIDFSGRVCVRGCGSWDGYYGNYIDLSNRNLKDPRPKEELFIYKELL